MLDGCWLPGPKAIRFLKQMVLETSCRAYKDCLLHTKTAYKDCIQKLRTNIAFTDCLQRLHTKISYKVSIQRLRAKISYKD